jgi:hypothetical protein
MNKNKLIGSALALIMTTSALFAAGNLSECLAARTKCMDIARAEAGSDKVLLGAMALSCAAKFNACYAGKAAVPSVRDVGLSDYDWFDEIVDFDFNEAMLIWVP